jgi:hypothetical protein
MLKSPAKVRLALWDGFRLSHDDPDALVRAVADADPTGPAPGPDEEDDDWPALRLGEQPAVEPFPVEVFPTAVAEFIRSVAAAIGCPPDFVGLPLLVVAGAAIGRTVSLRLKKGYFAGGGPGRTEAALESSAIGGGPTHTRVALERIVRPHSRS